VDFNKIGEIQRKVKILYFIDLFEQLYRQSKIILIRFC